MTWGFDPALVARTVDHIRARLPLTEVAGTSIRLHLAVPSSGLSQLEAARSAPYWAHAWPGGVALARHLAVHPDVVAGQTTHDLGTGSGLVAIASARSGALRSIGLDVDEIALLAVRINAQANGVPVLAVPARTGGGPAIASRPKPEAPLVVLAGDVFYDSRIARRMLTVFDALPHAMILVGDIGRRWLPRARLEPLACYPVRDVGDPPNAAPREGWVYRWQHR